MDYAALKEIIEADGYPVEDCDSYSQMQPIPFTVFNVIKYYPHIKINSSISPELKFVELTHEYGHWLSFTKEHWTTDYQASQRKFYDKFFNGIDNIILLDQDKKNIIREEKRAWDLGIKFAESLKFKFDKSFHQHKNFSLQSYYDDLGCYSFFGFTIVK